MSCSYGIIILSLLAATAGSVDTDTTLRDSRSNYDNVLYVQGWFDTDGDHYVADVQIANLKSGQEQEQVRCGPSDTPQELLQGAYLSYVNGEVLACGYRSWKCFRLADGQWFDSPALELSEAREDGAAVMIDQDTWWIAGGVNEDSSEYGTYSGDLYTTGSNGFDPAPAHMQLPLEMDHHKLAMVNHTHAILVYPDPYQERTRVFSKNIRDESVLDWTEHADLAFRNDPFVGVAYSPFKGLQLVVAGGSGLNEATQVYEDLRSSKVMDLDTRVWRDGPDLPTALSAGHSLPHRDTFLAFGGYINEYNEETGAHEAPFTIFRYDPQGETWVTEPNGFDRGSLLDTAATLVPEDFKAC